jgi:hypothetical protein
MFAELLGWKKIFAIGIAAVYIRTIIYDGLPEKRRGIVIMFRSGQSIQSGKAYQFGNLGIAMQAG